MADLDILKALQNRSLTIQTPPKPPTVICTDPTTSTQQQQSNEKKYDESELSRNLSAPGPTIQAPTEPLPSVPTMPQRDRICEVHENSNYLQQEFKLTAIENWIELLETPFKSCIFLANGNWQARQAATAISIARGRKTCVLSEKTCWACVVEQYPGIMRNEVVTFIA
jgi:hypothetical protein